MENLSSTLMLIVVAFLTGYWLLYLLVSARQKRWNDMFYGICILLIMFTPMNIMLSIISILAVIYLHNYIAVKEREEIESQEKGED